jgi:pilus assembly protein CpaF
MGAPRLLPSRPGPVVEAMAAMPVELVDIAAGGLEGLEGWMQVPGVTDIFARPEVTRVRTADGRWVSVRALAATSQEMDRLIRDVIKRANYRSEARDGEYDVSLPNGRLHATLDWAPWPTMVIRLHRWAPKDLGTLMRGGLGAGARSQRPPRLMRPGLGGEDLEEFLECCVAAKLNMLVTGGPMAGKTTLAAALCRLIPPDEQVVTIEDTYELGLHHDRDSCVAYLSRPPNLEGKGELDLARLSRGSLRDSADRVIVGEVRGAEALYMARAMSQGDAQGSIGTVHGKSALEGLERFADLILGGGEARTKEDARRMVAGAVDVVVHMVLADGAHCIGEVSEVGGAEYGTITTTRLWETRSAGALARTDARFSPALVRMFSC